MHNTAILPFALLDQHSANLNNLARQGSVVRKHTPANICLYDGAWNNKKKN